MRLTFILILVSLVPSVLFADVKTPFSREMPYIMRSVEALGMGNAFLAKSDNKYAAFYNPAGLGRVNKWSVDIVPITLGFNDRLLDTGSKAYDIWKNNKDNLDDPEVISDILDSLMGGYNNITPLTIYPAFVKKNFSFGIFSTSDVNLLAYNETLPELAIKARSDNGIVVAFARQVLENKSLSIGISVKAFARVGFTKSYTAIELAGDILDSDSFTKDIEDNGTGFAILGTIGVIYDLPFLEIIKPRVAATFADFGYTDLGGLSDPIDHTFNLSIACSPFYNSIITTDIVIDYVDVFKNAGYDSSIAKRINIGAEVEFFNIIAIRGGFHQGYPTLGAGIDLPSVLKINYAYYTEELGAYAGQYPDKRHAIELVIGI